MIGAGIFWTTIGSITVLVGAFFAVRRFQRWAWPLSVKASYTMWFEPRDLDQIHARIVNNSDETVYIVGCCARGTYSTRFIVERHLRSPLRHPRFYQTMRFGALVSSMMSEKMVKLAPNEPVQLSCSVDPDSILAITEPYFLVEVTLSNGRSIRSRKLETPPKWRRRLLETIARANA